MVWHFIGVYIINRTLHGRLEIGSFSSRVEKIFFNTRREISLSPRGHVISSIYSVLSPTRTKDKVKPTWGLYCHPVILNQTTANFVFEKDRHVQEILSGKSENKFYFRVVGDWVLFTYFHQGMVALLEIAVVITVMLIVFTPLQSVEWIWMALFQCMLRSAQESWLLHIAPTVSKEKL